jgi:hypothetical protein
MGGLDLGTIIQAVRRNNPGASPRVIAGAVNGFIPLMNAQTQMEWRQFQAEQRMQGQMLQFLLGTGRLQQGQQAIEQRGEISLANINQKRAEIGLPPLKSLDDLKQAQPGAAAQPGEPTEQPKPPAGAASSIADRVVQGLDPPDMAGLPMKEKGAVRNILAQYYPNFNLSDAQLDWKKAQKMIQTLGGPGIMRWQSTAHSALNTIKDVLEDARKLNLQGYSLTNKADLFKWTQNEPSSERGKLARDYLIKTGLLKSEMATLEQGGNAPTQDAWEVAKQTMSEDWAVGQIEAAAKALPDIIGYRLKAFDKISGGQFGQPSRYMRGGGTSPDQTETPPETPPAPGPGTTTGPIDLGGGIKATPKKRAPATDIAD